MPGAGRRERADAEAAALARVLVRAGQRSLIQVLAELRDACRAAGHDDAEAGSRRMLDATVSAVIGERTSWPRPTDHDRSEQALTALAAADIAVLRACVDHHDASRLLAERRPPAVVFFTETDVWHAVTHGMLEINVWHGDGAVAAEGEDLTRQVLAAYAAAGLPAVLDEGRVEVTMWWQRLDLPCLPPLARTTVAAGTHTSHDQHHRTEEAAR